VPLLVGEGHELAGMTLSPDKLEALRELGAEPVLADVYDRERLREAVAAFRPDAVMHQLTDLPDELERIPEMAAANRRIRTEGTRNLLDAAEAAGAARFVAQSIAWRLPTAPAPTTSRTSASRPGSVSARRRGGPCRRWRRRAASSRSSSSGQTLIVTTSPSWTT
jgi:nucleoside-diphosphate-sugar epimerase